MLAGFRPRVTLCCPEKGGTARQLTVAPETCARCLPCTEHLLFPRRSARDSHPDPAATPRALPAIPEAPLSAPGPPKITVVLIEVSLLLERKGDRFLCFIP